MYICMYRYLCTYMYIYIKMLSTYVKCHYLGLRFEVLYDKHKFYLIRDLCQIYYI